MFVCPVCVFDLLVGVGEVGVVCLYVMCVFDLLAVCARARLISWCMGWRVCVPCVWCGGEGVLDS